MKDEKELIPEEAKKLAIKKWKYIIDNDGNSSGLVDKFPELSDMIGNCAYCKLYLKINELHAVDCNGCPLTIKDTVEYSYRGQCESMNHPYYKWAKANTEKKKIKYAKQILNLIKILPASR